MLLEVSAVNGEMQGEVQVEPWVIFSTNISDYMAYLLREHTCVPYTPCWKDGSGQFLVLLKVIERAALIAFGPQVPVRLYGL